MADFEWKPFLDRLNAAVLAAPDVEDFDLPPEAVAAEWLGYAPASDDVIVAAEARLGVTLPPSYRAFLRASNGWQHCGGPVERVLPAAEIGWLRDLHPDWIDAWQTFGPYEYDPAVDEVDYRHLDKTLAVSAIGDAAILLLNPERIDADGEWEAWFFANWVPGAESYPSFWALLQAEYDSLVSISAEQITDQQRNVQPGDPPEAVITKLPGLIATIEAALAGIRGVSVRGIDNGYHAGTYEGLAEVLDRVRAIIPGEGADPAAVRAALTDLVAAAQRDAAEQDQSLRAQYNPGKLLGALGNVAQMIANLGPMQAAVKAGGRVQGLRQGSMIVQRYLGEG